MIQAADFWAGIDAIADRASLSRSRLATNAGFHPTALVPSKRHRPNGQPSWPSMRMVTSMLLATQTTPEEWARLVEAAEAARLAAEANAAVEHAPQVVEVAAGSPQAG